ncbi:DNA internalization-related competence protein ComEC/Rec2 [Brochothrix campestris]
MPRHLLIVSVIVTLMALTQEQVVVLTCLFLMSSLYGLIYRQWLALVTVIMYVTLIIPVPQPSQPIFSEPFVLQAIAIDGDYVQAVVKQGNSRTKLTGTIDSFAQKQQLETFAPGQQLHIEAELRPMQQRRNPQQFSENEYLKRQRIDYVATMTEMTALSTETVGVINRLAHLRQLLMQQIEQRASKRVVAYTHALIFGDRSAIAPDVTKAYRDLGVIHLLAISGLHVTLIGGGLFVGLLIMRCSRATAAMLTIAFLLVFAVMAGANAPVVRAVTMMVLLLVKELSPLRFTTFTALILSYNLQLIRDSYQLFQIGFQLSYAVCLGLVLSRQIIARYRYKPLQLAIVSYMATVFTLPILSYHFFQFSLASVWANSLFVPFYTALLIPVVILSVILIPLQLMPAFANNTLEWLLLKSERLALYFLDWPATVYVTGRAPPVSYWLLGCLIVYVFVCWENHRFIKRTQVLLWLFIASLPLQTQWANGGMIALLDVGQGDAHFIQLPNRQGTMLIDTGGKYVWQKPAAWQQRQKAPFTIGENVVNPTLKSWGIRHLDKVVITHSDYDHMGALLEVAAELSIGELIIGKGAAADPLMASMLAQLQTVKQREVKEGDTIMLGVTQFTVLNPLPEGGIGENEHSVVLSARLDEQNWLFTGDMEIAQEKRLMKQYPTLAMDFLMVGHHGSKFSTDADFVAQIGPKEAWISVAQNSQYGHPHPEVLAILNQQQVKIRSTAESGAIVYRFNGKKPRIELTITPSD